jgi:hypothetical protein
MLLFDAWNRRRIAISRQLFTKATPAARLKQNMREYSDERLAMKPAAPVSSSESRCAADRPISAAGDLG